MSRIIFRESAAPTTPASGQMTLFADTNGDLSWLDDGGNLTKLVTTGAATITLPNATDTVAVLGTAQTFTGQKTFNEDIVMASGKGISFAATSQAAGMTSETLTDYEEGTWTPTYLGTTTNPSVGYDPSTVGRYTKIGNVVHLFSRIQTDSVTGGSGNVAIGGLAYPATSVPNLSGSMSIGNASGFAGETPLSGIIAPTASRILLYYRATVDGPVVNTAIADLGTGSDANLIIFTATYMTD